MLNYALRRLLLIIPTLFGILTINFFAIQLAPGGPVEQLIASLEGGGEQYMEHVANSGADMLPGDRESGRESVYAGSEGLSPKSLRAIQELYGFDKPLLTRYTDMLREYLRFDFGKSLFKSGTVVELIRDALPVSISLGVWSTLLIYFISIPLGIARAVRQGSSFDLGSGFIVVIASAIPGFLFAVLLIVLFAGGSYWQLFPIRGLHSTGFEQMSFGWQVLDYLHHIALPVAAMTVGGFAALTMLTRNSFLDELSKNYVDTARAKGLTERRVLYRHVFRNAMLVVISGIPSTFIHMFFTGSLLIETIFSLNGLGLLGFEAALQRDYPVMFATLYIFTLIGLVASVIGDLAMMKVDPRIDFAGRKM